MKKIYSLLFVTLFLFLGYSCDDGSLDHSDVFIPDPVPENLEDDGFVSEPSTTAVIKMKIGEETSINLSKASAALSADGHTASGILWNVKKW